MATDTINRSSDALQAAFDAIDALTKDDPERAVQAATAKGLMFGYHAKWHDSGWTTLVVEQQFHLPIINPDTGRPSRTFTHAGKWDGIAAHSGKQYLVEHKSCSEDIERPDAPYWRRLDIDAQVSGYIMAKWQEGEKLSGTLYDCVRKPGIRPKKLTKADRQAVIHFGSYCGFAVSDETRAAVAAVEDENAELYQLRLSQDTTTRPEWYFQRKTITRLDSQILDYAQELWAIADEIRLARVNDRHYRNSNACMNFGRACEYLGICSGNDSPDSDRWKKRENVHSELTMDGNGRDVLSHSRMLCFKTCKKKHYLRYELGIERLDKEESEALYFGSILHEALAAWWSTLSVTTNKENACLA